MCCSDPDLWNNPLLTFSKDAITEPLTSLPSKELEQEAVKLFKVRAAATVLPAVRPEIRIRRRFLWSAFVAGLEMATDTVANETKVVRLATRSFQAVAKLATSSKLTA